MPLDLCVFKLKGGGTAAINPEAVRFVRDAGAGSVTIIIADDHEVIVEGKLEDVIDTLQHRS